MIHACVDCGFMHVDAMHVFLYVCMHVCNACVLCMYACMHFPCFWTSMQTLCSVLLLHSSNAFFSDFSSLRWSLSSHPCFLPILLTCFWLAQVFIVFVFGCLALVFLFFVSSPLSCSCLLSLFLSLFFLVSCFVSTVLLCQAFESLGSGSCFSGIPVPIQCPWL